MRQVRERIDAVNANAATPQRVAGSVSASPSGSTGPAPYDAGADIARALAGLMPGLNAYGNAMARDAQQAQNERDALDKKNALLEGKAVGERTQIADPMGALMLPEAMPSGVNPAYKPEFMDGYREAVGQGHGARVASAIREDYLKEKDTEGFDVETFLKKRVQSEFDGINDPLMLISGSRAVSSVAHEIRTNAQNAVHKRATETATANLIQSIDYHASAGMTPEVLSQQFHSEILPTARKLGLHSTPEVSAMFLDRLHVISQANGGMPEIFDAMLVPGPDGIAPGNAGKDIAEKVQAYKMQAMQQRSKDIKVDNEAAQFQLYANLEERVSAGQLLSVDDLLPHVGKGNLLSAEKGMDYINRSRVNFEKLATRGAAVTAMGTPTFALLPQAVRKQALADATAPILAALKDAAAKPDGEGSDVVKSAMTQLIGIHTSTPDLSEPIQDLIKQVAQGVPSKDSKPPPMFLSLVSAYQTLSQQAPHLAASYFPGDAGDIFKEFVRSRYGENTTVDVAYQRAYAGVSPESKASAAARAADPEFKKSISEGIHNSFVTGWTQFKASMPSFWGANGTAVGNAASEPMVVEWAHRDALRISASNPQLGPEEVIARATENAKQNFVWDPNIQRVMQVPHGRNDPASVKRYQNWTEGLVKEHRAAYGDDVQTLVTYAGNDTFTVSTLNPATRKDVKVGDIEALYAKKYVPSPEENRQVTDLRKKIADGTFTQADASANAELLAKATMLNMLPKAEKLKMDTILETTARSKMGNTLSAIINKNAAPYQAVDVGSDKASVVGTRNGLKPRLDDKRSVARDLMKTGDMAASLTALAEGVALTAYPDPSRGQNIGIGYNMDENAKTLVEDFRKAGIDASSIPGIKEGTTSITRDQAVRLYKTVQPRYEAVAKGAVEKLHPGNWDALPPQHKAVLTDMAYQMGHNVEKFTKALGAFVRGDMKTVQEEIKTTFVDRTSGERRVDNGRHNLRLAMLTSPTAFNNLINYAK